MDLAWIQVFVLTVAECVAPAGKTVCQQQELELQFLTRADCVAALEQFIALKDASEYVIIDVSKSGCSPSARQQNVYSSAEDVSKASADAGEWRAPDTAEPVSDDTRKQHERRLDELKSCDETRGVAPCRIGDIIVEEEARDSRNVEVWRRN